MEISEKERVSVLLSCYLILHCSCYGYEFTCDSRYSLPTANLLMFGGTASN